MIHKHIGPERLLLWDSKARGGRPDSMKILKEAYSYWDAEGNHLATLIIEDIIAYDDVCSCLHHVKLHRQF